MHSYGAKAFWTAAALNFDRCRTHSLTLLVVRDGLLENLWGGRAKYKKNSRKGKLNEKKFHARQITLRNNHAKDLFSKRTCFRKQFLRLENSLPPPDNFSNGLSLNRVGHPSHPPRTNTL